MNFRLVSTTVNEFLTLATELQLSVTFPLGTSLISIRRIPHLIRGDPSSF